MQCSHKNPLCLCSGKWLVVPPPCTNFLPNCEAPSAPTQVLQAKANPTLDWLLYVDVAARNGCVFVFGLVLDVTSKTVSDVQSEYVVRCTLLLVKSST